MTGKPTPITAPTPEEWARLDQAARCYWWGEMLELRWSILRHAYQVPGDGREHWRVHWLQAGRGAGKTRGAAEWMLQRRLKYPGTRGGLLGPKFRHVRRTMLYGKSGLITLLPNPGLATVNLTDRVIQFANGSVIEWFSSEQPEDIRGPEFHDFWIDEPAELSDGKTCFQNMRGAVRLKGIDGGPRALLTGTPKPVELINLIAQRIRERPDSFTRSRGSTLDNRGNLDAEWLADLQDEYAGTSLWAQEMAGELLGQAEGALWQQSWIKHARSADHPRFEDVILAIDPSDSWEGDECGLLTLARTSGKHPVTGRACRLGFVLADDTVRESMASWTKLLPGITRTHGVSTWVIEASLGATLGETIEAVRSENDLRVKIEWVPAKGSKAARAEPVARQYEQGLWTHLTDTPGGSLDLLEAEQIQWEPGVTKRSPNRIDALAHGGRWLLGKGVRKGSSHRPNDLVG